MNKVRYFLEYFEAYMVVHKYNPIDLTYSDDTQRFYLNRNHIINCEPSNFDELTAAKLTELLLILIREYYPFMLVVKSND